MTLIELMVVFGIVSLLVALLLPAVQAAREASRRAHCLSNLRQFGTAIAGYQDAYSCFPIGLSSDTARAIPYYGYYSVHSRLLPYLDAQPVYRAINFDVGVAQPDLKGYDSRLDLSELLATNTTVLRTQIATFLCPSDRGGVDTAPVNYRACMGVGPMGWRSVRHPDSGNGLFPETVLVRAAYVPDGLSNTAAFSERVLGSGRRGAPIPSRDSWHCRNGVSGADDTLVSCRIAARPQFSSGAYVNHGAWWLVAGQFYTTYNHVQTPNGSIPDCYFGQLTAHGMSTARSRHPGGINLLMGDGSCRFVLDTIAQPVWRAYGSRNGREVVE